MMNRVYVSYVYPVAPLDISPNERVKKMDKIILAILIGILGIPLVVYIIGRILLPEMGLTAPGYWAWFWASLIGTGAYAIVRGVQGALVD